MNAQTGSSSLPQAYRLPGGTVRSSISPVRPQVVFLEVTNRCNLRCETCPRTFVELEPAKTLSMQSFYEIMKKFPGVQRVLLHGIGEPLLNHNLPGMIRFLKQRGIEVLINTNGTLLTPSWQADLIESGLDELRCSIDAARPETYNQIRGADSFGRLLSGVAGLTDLQQRLGKKTPRISLWMVATRENLGELPDLVRLAARLQVSEVYVQRLVYFADEPEAQFGMARRELAIFGDVATGQELILEECEKLSAQYGIAFRASGARDPRGSLAAQRETSARPWQACMRPWTTAYVTANGNCLPCCLAPFTTANYNSLILGNLNEQSFEDIWNGERYQAFRKSLLSSSPPQCCRGCGVYWSL